MNSKVAGPHWPSELTVTKDPISGATVRQLTNYRAPVVPANCASRVRAGGSRC
jgi:hypothetical protein